MFNLQLLPMLNCTREEIDGFRHYRTPTGNVYPSVTTGISELTDKSFLDRWKARIGAAEAAAITARSGVRGSRLHHLCEKFLKNEDLNLRDEMPSAVEDFLAFKPDLQKNVEVVYGSEYPLYSDALKLAGTTDLICRWKGYPAIVDFKTSRKGKPESWIGGYFIQSCLYARMANEHYHLDIKDIVIILLPEHGRFPKIFEKKVKDYDDKVDRFIGNYHALLDKHHFDGVGADA